MTERVDDVSLVDLRCSMVVLEDDSLLLLHRTGDVTDDWVLPGGRPRPGESMLSCVRREVRSATLGDGEPDARPAWVDRQTLRTLPMRPPLAGHLNGLSTGTRGTAAYLGNMWRPSHVGRTRPDGGR